VAWDLQSLSFAKSQIRQVKTWLSEPSTKVEFSNPWTRSGSKREEFLVRGALTQAHENNVLSVYWRNPGSASGSQSLSAFWLIDSEPDSDSDPEVLGFYFRRQNFGYGRTGCGDVKTFLGADEMFKFLHAADLHLDSPMRGLERYEGAPVEQIRGATRRALENLVQLAVDEKVRFVLIAGDLYDGDWKDYNTALFLASQMSHLRKAGILVFVIKGNHDASSQITRSLSMPENVRFLSTENRKPSCSQTWMLPYTAKGSQNALSARTSRLDTRLLERDYLTSACFIPPPRGAKGTSPYAPCSVEGLLSKNYDYWALGHVHRRELLHENPWIVFSGNIQGRHVNESGRKGCTLVTVENGRCSCVEHRDLNVVTWAVCEVNASAADSPRMSWTSRGCGSSRKHRQSAAGYSPPAFNSSEPAVHTRS